MFAIRLHDTMPQNPWYHPDSKAAFGSKVFFKIKSYHPKLVAP
ncbi:hypothetical protein C2W64_02112 [Brevibacillus laterosporus]|nr:hypothetical protein C2W64_02112 [Brevibacillus laterosporus]